jgi:hypothetical protein
MAIDTGLYSPTQIYLGYVAETTLGTAKLTTAGSETLQLINITGLPTINREANRDLAIRSTAGRVAKKEQIYVNQKGAVKEISFTCRYDQTVAANLLENCLGVAVGASPASYDIAGSYTSAETKWGDTDTDFTGAITFTLIQPETGDTEVYPGCFVKSFRMYADVASEGGLFNLDIVVQTRGNIAQIADITSWTQTALKTTYRTIHDMSTKVSVGGSDVVMNSIDLTIDNQVKFFGVGTDGVPSQIGRGIPEILATGIIGMKYDLLTAPFLISCLDENDIAVEISNNATWASATFGVKGAYGQISDSFDLDDVEGGTFVNVPLQFLGTTSGDVIQIVP